jgi:hypothetical protein
MAQAIRALYAMSAEERAALGQNAARAYADNYSQAALVGQYETLFESVLAKRRSLAIGFWRSSQKRV